MSRQHIRGIFHSRSSLEKRFERVADLRNGVNEESKDYGFPERGLSQKGKMNDQSPQTRKKDPDHTPLPCLFGAGKRCHRVFAEELAESERSRISGNDGQQEKIDKKRPIILSDQEYVIEGETHIYRPKKRQGDHLRKVHHLFQ